MSSAITIVAPQNITESEQLSEKLAKSALIPDALKGKPGDILATLLTGAELGLAPMQSLRGIQIIKGKPTLSADLMGALVKRNREVCQYLRLVESTPERATYETQRVGSPKPTTMTYTMADAVRAGLANSDTYKKHPAPMLRARCLAGICRAEYQDLCFGMYDSDSGEISEPVQMAPVLPIERDVTPTPTPAKSRTATVAARVAAAVGSIVDVQPGESEADAAALHARRQRIIDMGKDHGFNDKDGFAAWIATKIGSRKQFKALTAEDCTALEAAFSVMQPPDSAPDAASEVAQ